MTIDVGTHNHEHRVHSIIRKADEINNCHPHTCMPYLKSSLLSPQLVVPTRFLEHPVPLLPPLVVQTRVLTPLGLSIWNDVDLFLPPFLWHQLVSLLIVQTRVLLHQVPLSPPLVVQTRVLLVDRILP
jgi:hypothetical protein